MENKNEKTSKMDFEALIKSCAEKGITVTVDRNPSPEKVAYIKEQIAKFRKLQEDAIENYKKLNK